MTNIGNLNLTVVPTAIGRESEGLQSERRQEVRVDGSKVCGYNLCESIEGEQAVIEQGEVYSLNRRLENLQYDEITLTIDGDLGDRVAVKMHIRGRNPNFQKGRPVALNVNVDLPLGSLLRAASVATGVPDEIEAQVQKAMGKEKP